jgi:hypothetical protein
VAVLPRLLRLRLRLPVLLLLRLLRRLWLLLLLYPVAVRAAAGPRLREKAS